MHICFASCGLWARKATPEGVRRVSLDRKTRTVEVLHFEHTGSTLGRGALQLWRVDLYKSLRIEIFAKELANA